MSTMERFREILGKIAHYGFNDFLEESRWRRHPVGTMGGLRAKNFRLLLEDLGPAAIKLGQILSTRPDLLPMEYIEELENLQDAVPPAPWGRIERVLEHELDLNCFSEIDHHPLASASLAQVHAARLRSGEEVVLKVQYPDVAERIEKDLPVMHRLAEFFSQHSRFADVFDFPGIVRQLDTSLHRELDLDFERSAMERIAATTDPCGNIVIPKVVPALCTKRVLTMERVHGRKIDCPPPGGNALASAFLLHVLHQVVDEGFFHADPHPGNFLITPDGKLAMLDFGMIGNLDFQMRRSATLLLLGLVNQQGASVAEELVRMGEPTSEFELAPFRRAISDTLAHYQFFYGPAPNIGEMMITLIQQSTAWHLKSPAELTLLSKTLIQVDSVSRMLDPDIRPAEIIAAPLQQAIFHQLWETFTPTVIGPSLLDASELLLNASRRFNVITERLISEDKVRIQFEHVGLEKLVFLLGGTINHLAIAVIAASLFFFAASLLQARLGMPWLLIAIVAVVVAVFLTFLVFLAVSRRREF
ncbi:MAG: ABC1 kinase family protein [Bacteroidota bacterium]